MSPDQSDKLLKLLLEANSEEELLSMLDARKEEHEVVSALEGEGRLYELENDLEFTELETLSIGIAVKLYEYLYREPPEKRPQEIVGP